MIKKAFLITFILATMLNANMTDWIENFDEAKEISKEDGKPIFVFFEMDGCGVCQFMKHEVLDDGNVFEYLDSHFVSYKHNIDDKPYPIDIEIQGTPTMYFLDSDGNKIGKRILGGKKASYFLEELKKRYSMYENN